MSLDQNLFTLAIAASADETGALDLTDPATNTVYYRKRVNPGDPENPYSWGLYDPLSNGLLCTVTAPSASSKQKWIELHNPEVKVELAYTPSFTFKWIFDWEGHTFEWRRENCYLLRKPDPPVQVAVTREPAGRIKTSQVQLLDYNLNRFDIEDRKGLEIVMLAALLTFQDYSESLRPPQANDPPSRHNSDGGPPPLPVKSGAEIISSLQAVNKAQSNDVIVGSEVQVEEYAKHCVDMLKDPSMLYIVLRPQSSEEVAKVIQVAEATKRFHYKWGGHEEELHQYVTLEEAKPEKKGPKVIKLDDNDGKKKKEKEYKPPQTVTVHLSKIPMPELQPKAPPSTKASPNPSSSSFFGKRGGRNPSPSRPPAQSASSSSSAGKLNKSSSPPPSNQPPNPYRYDMVLYPPTGPMPSFYDTKPKQTKPEEKKDHQQNNGKSSRPSSSPIPPPPSYQMPGSYPSAPGPSGSGAINASRPPPSPSGYAVYNRPTPPGSTKYSGGPPPGPPPSSTQPASLSTALASNIANAGYSILDKLTHKQVPSGPTKH